MTATPDPVPDPPPDTAPAVIPADDHLPPGARPFTDFGQFGYGHIDLRVLEQDIYWVNIAGTPFFVTDLTPEYRRNVIGHLRENATAWWIQLLKAASLEANYLVLTHAPEDEITATIDLARRLDHLGPEAWMEQTVLMRRLRQQAPGQRT